MPAVITPEAIKRRAYWVREIQKLSGNFGDDSAKVEAELSAEIAKSGVASLVDHLRLCGDIPEEYGHDSSEEKLYSKYTDALLAEAFNAIGLKALVLKERADAADVEVFSKKFSFVADAKSFRLSRTAKNQKDFKVQAMDGWKRGKPYAMVVCPIYQLPTKASQIYEQASARNVCVFTYSHLSVLVMLAAGDAARTQGLLLRVFQAVETLNPSKDAKAYWAAVNTAMLSFGAPAQKLWVAEKTAAVESIKAAKEEALSYLARERERIMRMDHKEALAELVKLNKLESRERVILSLSDNGLLDIR